MEKPFVIALTGPESCGKSTLAKQLSDYFDAPFVPEYAREYLEKTKGRYQFEDLEIIGKGQNDLLEIAKTLKPKLIIVDTELTVIKIWSEYKYGKTAKFLENLYGNQEIDLYLLCKPDLSWVEDPLRESENDRAEIFDLYEKELIALNRNYKVILGQGETRTSNARAFVEQFIENSN